MAIDLKKKTSGRPTSLTKEVHDKLLKLIGNGNYINTACQAVGINYSTFRNWLDSAKTIESYLGKNDIYIDNPDDIYNIELPQELSDKLIYWRFFTALKKAEAGAECRHVQNLNNAGKNPAYWAASATYLERKFPERWGRRDALDVNVKEGTERLERYAKILQASPAKQLNSGQ